VENKESIVEATDACAPLVLSYALITRWQPPIAPKMDTFVMQNAAGFGLNVEELGIPDRWEMVAQ
jgi:hypothetical protein